MSHELTVVISDSLLVGLHLSWYVILHVCKWHGLSLIIYTTQVYNQFVDDKEQTLGLACDYFDLTLLIQLKHCFMS